MKKKEKELAQLQRKGNNAQESEYYQLVTNLTTTLKDAGMIAFGKRKTVRSVQSWSKQNEVLQAFSTVECEEELCRDVPGSNKGDGDCSELCCRQQAIAKEGELVTHPLYPLRSRARCAKQCPLPRYYFRTERSVGCSFRFHPSSQRYYMQCIASVASFRRGHPPTTPLICQMIKTQVHPIIPTAFRSSNSQRHRSASSTASSFRLPIQRFLSVFATTSHAALFINSRLLDVEDMWFKSALSYSHRLHKLQDNHAA